MNIPRNTASSMYNAWFRKEYQELFEREIDYTELVRNTDGFPIECDIKKTVESCEECGFCEVKNEREEEK